MDFKIRPILHTDLPFMREMLYQSIFVQPPLPRSVLDAPEFRHYISDWGKLHDAGFIAADSDSAPVGAAWLRLLTQEDSGYGFVDDDTPEVCTLAVVPEWRGQGVGQALMVALLRYADGRYAQVSLSCDPNNPAMRLYQRVGFVYHGISGTSHTLLRKRA